MCVPISILSYYNIPKARTDMSQYSRCYTAFIWILQFASWFGFLWLFRPSILCAVTSRHGVSNDCKPAFIARRSQTDARSFCALDCDRKSSAYFVSAAIVCTWSYKTNGILNVALVLFLTSSILYITTKCNLACTVTFWRQPSLVYLCQSQLMKTSLII